MPAVRTSTCLPFASARSIVKPGPTVPTAAAGRRSAADAEPERERQEEQQEGTVASLGEVGRSRCVAVN